MAICGRLGTGARTGLTLSHARGRWSQYEFRAGHEQRAPRCVAATALTVIRRALIEGVPVTPKVVEREASVNLRAPPTDAMQQVDMVAQRLGVSSLG